MINLDCNLILHQKSCMSMPCLYFWAILGFLLASFQYFTQIFRLGSLSNHVHQATAAIVKTKPSKVVLEDLNVKGMMKNRHLSRAVACEKFSEFRRQMEYKTKFLGIELVIADKFYPSSKKCSCCGHIKKDLKLKDRTYVCPECGLMIDRDYNASINLANYGT